MGDQEAIREPEARMCLRAIHDQHLGFVWETEGNLYRPPQHGQLYGKMEERKNV